MIDVYALGAGEGWALFDSFGSTGGPYQIQKLDDPDGEPEWADDADVWDALWVRHLHGDPTLGHLMAFLADENPIEYDAIVRWCITGPRDNQATINTQGMMS